MRALPRTLQIQGVISNTPIEVPLDFAEGARFRDVRIKGAQPTVGTVFGRPFPVAGALLSKIPVPISPLQATVQGFDVDFDRARACWDQIIRLQTESILVDVTTTLQRYTAMAIQQCTATRNAKFGNALSFTMSLLSIRIGKTEAVAVPALSTTKKNQGRKVPAPKKDAPVPKAEESLLHKALH
jgi:hypothetical protein